MEQYTASLMQALPKLSATVPVWGTIDFTPVVAALVLFIAISIFFKVVLVMVINRLERVSAKTSTDVDDVVIAALQGIRSWVYTLVALYVAMKFFALPALVDTVLSALVYIAVAWQVIEVVLCFIGYAAQRFLEKDEDGDGVVDPNAATASHLVTMIARIVLYALGVVFVLSNLGIEVTSLIAGLGIGGVAIAFALQGVLSDLFASFSIYADKPFRIGDFITIGTDSGTVEKIGVKTTRIRTLQGEELVVSNAELTTARVQNFKKLQERRGTIQFGIAYETDHALVKQVNGMVEDIFQKIDGIRFDRCYFTTFGDSALIFDVVFYAESAAYVDFLEGQQQFNFALMDKFAELGIEFAYPTQTIYHKAV